MQINYSGDQIPDLQARVPIESFVLWVSVNVGLPIVVGQIVEASDLGSVHTVRWIVG